MGGFKIVRFDTTKFISFEGGEGAGKSTQIRLLYKYLENNGIPVLMTREPGGSKGAEEIRKLLVEGETDRWDALTETMLLMAARRSHMRDVIVPSMTQGQWVLCDRFIDSTMAYQGYGQGLEFGLISQLQLISIGTFVPNLTILLDIDAELGLRRVNTRGNNNRYEEMDKKMHAKVRNGYLKLAAREPDRFEVINACQTTDTVATSVLDCIRRRFNTK